MTDHYFSDPILYHICGNFPFYALLHVTLAVKAHDYDMFLCLHENDMYF